MQWLKVIVQWLTCAQMIYKILGFFVEALPSPQLARSSAGRAAKNQIIAWKLSSLLSFQELITELKPADG